MRSLLQDLRTGEDRAATVTRPHDQRFLKFEEGVESLLLRSNQAAELYCDTFNTVAGIQPKWHPDRAIQFLRDRTQRPGVISVLVVDGNRLAAAFVAVLDRTADGVWIRDADLMVRAEYRREGLGGTLYYRAHLYAERRARAAFGERPSTIEFSTYRHPDYPKNWWLRMGHKSFPLFSSGLASGLKVATTTDTAIRQVMRSDVDGVAGFMAGMTAHDFDGCIWTKRGAVSFLNFELQNRGCLVRFAVASGEIVGVIAGDLVMRRSGPFLTHLTCIERRPQTSGRVGLAEMMLADIASAANTQSLGAFNMRVVGLELTQCQARRLSTFLPDIRQDTDFIGMSMPFDAFMAAMETRQSSIALPRSEREKQNRADPVMLPVERNRCRICSKRCLPLDPRTGRRFVPADPRECGRCGAVVTR
jgi:GNAT superfamily N-acetyltransferase